MPEFVPGLELSRRFYQEAVRPILEAELPQLKYSAALIGYGSEVLGFDTERSTDHNWGPRLFVLLADQDDDVREQALELMAGRLPETFAGWPVDLTQGVVVQPLGRALNEWLGFDPRGGVSLERWLSTPSQALLETIAGAVYHDGLGQLQRLRAALAWYPRDVWLYLMACQWRRIAQEEAIIGRCGEVGDELGSTIVAARLVRDLMRLCFLQERRYAPYSKWLGTAFKRLACGPELDPALKAVLAGRVWKHREHSMSVVYERVAQLHNALEVTEPLDTSVRGYFDRPFMVIGGDRFADALRKQIAYPAVRALGDQGGIDQYVDSTELLDDPSTAQRIGSVVARESARQDRSE